MVSQGSVVVSLKNSWICSKFCA